MKVAALNTPPCSTGHCDWRVPTVRELQSLANYGASDPAVSPVFDTSCVPGCTVMTCSCTSSDYSWSSSTYEPGPSYAWYVYFVTGYLEGENKSYTKPVRAVRGGS